MAVEDFGATPGTFDLDAWIDQGTRPRREVKVYRDWSLLKEWDQLEEALRVAELSGEESMGEAGAETIREQMQDVLDRLKASELTFTLQAITNSEREEIARNAPRRTVDLGDGKTREEIDNLGLSDALVARAVIDPVVTVEQITRLRETLGEGPVTRLYDAALDLMTQGQELPKVPSSREH